MQGTAAKIGVAQAVRAGSQGAHSGSSTPEVCQRSAEKGIPKKSRARRWTPVFNRNAAWGRNWQRETQRASSWDWRRASPRRGPLWPRFGYPGGTSNKVCWKRGGLAGAIPEALCGEAPKGQPVDRRENPVTVSVEDPEGHLMIHGCPRPRNARTSGKPKERRALRVPPSSHRTKMDRRRAGDRSRGTLPEKPAASGKT